MTHTFGDPPPKHSESEFLEQGDTYISRWWVTGAAAGLQKGFVIWDRFKRSVYGVSSELICLCFTKKSEEGFFVAF